MTFPMWPHQQKAFDQFWAHVDAGKKRICTVGACGAGKTRLSSEIIKEANRRNLKTVFSVNRKSLAEQSRKVLEGLGLDPGMRASGYKTDFDKPLQISMTPTEGVRTLGKNPSWNIHNADIVFFDEAHNERSARSLALIKKYEESNPNVVFCGLTATPLDISHIYDTLVLAGINSELRECGAHLICKEYCPTMPDYMSMKRNAEGEYSEKTVNENMKPEIVFGHILPHYRRLNPMQRPTIVFAPSVRGSITITDMFLNAGIPSAHIDAKHIYYGEKDADGRPVMEDSMKIKNREKLFDEVRNGEIKIISSRFLLTEGIDLPQVGHLIFATSYGSLKMFLQAGGRVLRAHDSLDYVTCIARGSKVLTDRGLVNIQDVSLADKVWDGVEFVSHDGAICKGVQKVIEWDGVTATPEHEVYTSHGWETIETAKSYKRRIARTGMGRVPVRLSEDIRQKHTGDRIKPEGAGSLRKMWKKLTKTFLRNEESEIERVCPLHEQVRSSLPRMAMEKGPASKAQMHKSRGRWLRAIWRERNRVSLPFSVRRGLLDSKESRDSRGPKFEHRQDRQRGTLRAWEPQMGNCQPAGEKQEESPVSILKVSNIPERLSISWLFEAYHRLFVQEGSFWSRHLEFVGEVPERGKRPEVAELKVEYFHEGISSRGVFKVAHTQADKKRSNLPRHRRELVEDCIEGGGESSLRSCEYSQGNERKISRSRIHCGTHKKAPEARNVSKGDTECLGEKQEVWDIVNCGPRQRFTVSDKLVHNCQDHGANCHVHGSLNDDRIWDLSDSSKSLTDQTLKDRKEGKSEEPIICPRCSAMRLSGPECHECGHKSSNSGVNILQHDGTLRQVKGPYVKRKAKTTSDATKAWFSIYFPSSKSRSNKAMTFKQALSQYKNKNRHLTVFNTTDSKGKERVAVAENNGTVTFLPMTPPVNNEYLWSQKVRDVQKKDLL